MDPEQDGIEPFNPADNLADTAQEFEDDDRDDDSTDGGVPALNLPVGGGELNG